MAVERHGDDVHRMPVWKSYLYFLQQQAPKPKRIVCQNETPNKPPFYGREYHGAISREDADFLLTIQGEGSYLIRESLRAPGQYTLAIRFEGVTKNFKLYYDGQHYVGEKRFDTINDLVADGLITFYLESKASDYIATLSSRSNYAESPYVAYNTHKKQQLNLAQQPLSGAKHHAAANKAAAHSAGNSSSGVAAQNDDDGFYEQPQATPVASNHSAASSSGGAASGSSSGSGRSGNRSDSGGRSAASGAARSKKSSAASSSKISNGSAVGGAGSAAAMPASSVGAVVGASIVTSQDVYDTPASNSSVHHAVGVNVGVGVGMGVGGVQQQRDRRRQKRESAPPSVHSTPAHQSDSGDSGSPSSNHHHRHNQQPQLPLQPTPKHKQSANNNKDSLQTSSQAVAAQRNAHEQVSRRRSGPRDSQPHHHDPTQPHQGRSSSGSGVSGRTSSSSSSSATPPAVPPHAVPPNAVSTSAHTTPVHVGAIAAGSGAAPPQSPSAGSALSSSPVGASTGAGPIHRTPHTPQMGSRSKVNLPVEGRLSQILETRKQHDAQHHQQHAAAPAAAAVTAAGTSSVTTTTTTTTATTATTANNVATSNSNGSGTGSSGGGGDSSSVNGRINHSTNTDGPSSTTSSATRWRPCSVQEYDKAHRFNKMFDDNPQFSTPPSSPPNSLPPSAGAGMHSPSSGAILGSPGGLVINTGGMAGLGSPPSSADQAKASSVSWCANYLSVQGCAKPHNFKLYTFKGPHWCDFCANFLWGLIAQGVKCQDCGFNAHKKCSEKVPNDCMPDMRYVKRMFGVDLTTLVKAQNTLIPVVVEMCIKEIENRGIRAEGLYRVAGFHDDVEAIKMSFDKDGELTDISEERYEDLNTITSLLKLYFRLLPIPLITFDIYYKVIELVKQEPLTSEERLMMLQQTLKLLQPAHYHTLKYLIGHLHRVQELQQYNMMSAENLSIVFAPTLLRSPESDDPLTSLSAVKYERELVELMVIHYQQLFE